MVYTNDFSLCTVTCRSLPVKIWPPPDPRGRSANEGGLGQKVHVQKLL